MPQTSAAGAALPADANLENLKKQAKALLRHVRSGRRDAVLRLNAAHMKQIDPGSAKLSDAQYTIAVEYGFASWPKLKAACVAQSDHPAARPIDGPPEVPMMPLRDLVVFPGASVPLFVGRSKSLKALEACLDDKSLLVCTQHDAQTDDVTESEVFTTGTIVTPLQLLKLNDGTVKVLVEGRQTVQVDALDLSGDYTKATVSPMSAPATDLAPDKVEHARELFVRLASHLGLSPKLTDTFKDETDVERLVGLAIQNFVLGVEDQQRLLEMVDVVERLDHALAQFARLQDELTATRLEDYVGRYQLAPDFLIDVAIHNGSLIASTPWERHRLQPRGGEMFVPMAARLT